MSEFDYSKTIGGFKGEKIKSGMLGNSKSRGFLSNNLPFRLANGLAPGNPLQFLWPTGTEAGGYWDFGNSGDQTQASSGNDSKVTAVGQAVGTQLDGRINPVQHSLNLSDRVQSFVGAGAQTIWAQGNVITFENCASNDQLGFSLGAEFPPAEFGRCEVVFRVDKTNGAQLSMFAGHVQSLGFFVPGIYIACTNGSLNGNFAFRPLTAGATGQITVLSITGYPGNHLSQATATARPLSAIETISGWNQSVYSGRFDGIDDGMSTPTFAAGTLTNNMDFFCAIKPTANAAGPVIMYRQDLAQWIGYFKPGDAVSGSIQPGLLTTDLFPYVNGVPITNTGDAAAAALGLNGWKIFEGHNLNLNTWTQLQLANYTAEFFTGNVGIIALCPAQSVANRDLARRIIGAEVGLLL